MSSCLSNSLFFLEVFIQEEKITNEAKVFQKITFKYVESKLENINGLFSLIEYSFFRLDKSTLAISHHSTRVTYLEQTDLTTTEKEN
jgi:hypothetical protein